jgi:hypothetical protein
MGWFSDFFEGDSIIPNPAADYLKGPEKAAGISAAASERTAAAAEALNRERYKESLTRLDPYMASELRAREQLDVEMGLAPGEAGTAYMQTPGYQTSLDEAGRAVEQTAATSGSTLYGGRRLQEAGKAGAGVQQSYYNNYMNMLTSMANPTTATNVSSLGMGQAATIGGQNIASTAQAGQFRQAGAQQTQQAQGDILGGIIGMFM